LLGDRTTAELLAAYGGQTRSVSKSISRCAWLIDVIGQEKTELFLSIYGGMTLTFPGGRISQMISNARRLRDEGLNMGLKTNDIAARSGLSVRSVYRRRAAQKLDKNQRNFFDD